MFNIIHDYEMKPKNSQQMMENTETKVCGIHDYEMRDEA